MKKVLLLSGGVDSISVAYWQRPSLALTVDYGQHSGQKEIQAASFVARELEIEHRIIRAGAADLGTGLMSASDSKAISPVAEWWPFRNQLLITLAGMLAVKEDCQMVLIGSVKSDRQMKDGCPEFLQAFRSLLAVQEGAIQLEAPASELTSLELVRLSGIPQRLLMASHSCHVGDIACGHCRGCFKHEETFQELGLLD